MDNQPSVIVPDTQSPEPSPPIKPPVRVKHAHKFIFGYIALIVLIAAVGGVYSWQHKKVNESDAKVASLQSQLNSLQNQVNKLSKQKQTTQSSTTQASNPYAGWSSYTLKYEKATFKYPSNWHVSDTSTNGQDMVALSPPDTFYLNIDTVNLGHPSVDYPTTIVDSVALTFLNQSGYINYFSGSSSATNSTINAELSMSSSSIFDNLFPTKNLSPSGVYSISLGNKTTSMTLSNIKADPSEDNADAKLILESVSY
jgi:outer membrane murein-binding lipoprotein Lpp